MLERIKKEIERRMSEKGYTDISMKNSGKLIRIVANDNLWTKETMYYTMFYSRTGEVIGEYKTLAEVARKIEEFGK